MEKICKQAAEKLVNELKKDETRATLESELLDPAIRYIGQRLYPYVIAVSMMLCVTLVLLFYIFIHVRFRYRSSLLGHQQ